MGVTSVNSSATTGGSSPDFEAQILPAAIFLVRLSFWCGYLSGVAIFPVKTVLMVFVFCTLCVDTSDSPNAMTLVKGTVKWIGGPNLI